MITRLPIAFCAVLGFACARAGEAPGPPHIAANQSGLSERILLATQEPTADESETNGPEVEATAANGTAAEPVSTDSEHPRSEHPEKPDPESSSQRVAFRRSGNAKRAEENPMRKPDGVLGPERDPRRALFDAREEERLRRLREE